MNNQPPPHPGPPYVSIGFMVFRAYTCRVHELDEYGLPVEIAPVYDTTMTEHTPRPEDDMWVHTYILTDPAPLIHDRQDQPEQNE